MEVTAKTKAEAMRNAQMLGLNTFTWHPCEKCGCTERRAYSGVACVDCDRKRLKKYQAANKERCKELNLEWQKNNREYLRMKARADSEKRSEQSAAAKVANEYGLTLLEVATAWGSRASVVTIFGQNQTKFRIICAGVKEMSK